MAPFAHKIGPAALDRLVTEAVARFMPAKAAQDARDAADGRHVRIHHDQVSFSGTSYLEGELDLADALDLDAALSQRRGVVEGRWVRRVPRRAPRDRRRGDRPPTSSPWTSTPTPTRALASSVDPGRGARQVVLHVHLSDQAITGTGPRTGLDGCEVLGRVENTRAGITAEQVRGWCANPEATIVIRPVIDLQDHYATDAYTVPDRLRTQTEERDHTCVFPWCTRAARACDCDHVIARDRGGTTCSCNIAPLCRRHHRLKTKTTWTYTVLEPGTYLWSSPHGYQFLREATGTLDVTRDQRPHGARSQPSLPAPQARPTRALTPPPRPRRPSPSTGTQARPGSPRRAGKLARRCSHRCSKSC